MYCDRSRRSDYYSLSQFALNLTSLNILNLEDLKLEYCSHTNLPSLKSLSLLTVEVEDEVLNNLLLGCPSLQKLFILAESFEPFNRRILSSSLTLLNLEGCWHRIQVEAINLESFVFQSVDFDLASCKKLRSLSITLASLCIHGGLENLVSGLPLLGSLTLRWCYPIDIGHKYLKVLVLEKFDDDEEDIHEISVDAPNLVSFNYHVEAALLRIVMNTPNLLETNINLEFYQEAHDT